MKRKILAGIGILAVVVAGVGFFWPFPSKPKELKLHGLVETQEVRLSSKVGGRVARVAVAEGDAVAEGQALVHFETRELEVRKAQLQAQLQAAQASFDRMYAGPRIEEKSAAAEALRVAAAKWHKLKTGYRSEEKAQARAKLAFAEIELARARSDFERHREVMQSVSPTEFERAQSTLKKNEQLVADARAHSAMMEAGYRAEEIAEAEAEHARLKALWEMMETGNRPEDKAEARAKVDELQAKIAEVDIALDEAVVRAAEPAVVEVVGVRKGDVVAANAPVVRVLRSGEMWVKAYVPETQLGHIHLQQQVDVTVDSHPGERFRGTVYFIAGSSEYTPRNVQSSDERRHQVFAVKIRVADPGTVFKSGMAAEVLIPVK